MRLTEGQILLDVDDLLNIPQDKLPMPVFSDDLRGFFSWAIKVHEQWVYNHFMWMTKPGIVASQSWLYKEVSIKNYVKRSRLKLWYCKGWTENDRKKAIEEINRRLSEPWYSRLYDVPAIVGQAIHMDWLHIPWLDICSDSGSVVKTVDSRYNLKNPDPRDVNVWLSKYPDMYEVYGRYVPD